MVELIKSVDVCKIATTSTLLLLYALQGGEEELEQRELLWYDQEIMIAAERTSCYPTCYHNQVEDSDDAIMIDNDKMAGEEGE